MPTNYMYRLDHDTGFAPHVSNGVCTLSGCKTNTVEAWAQPGSWVIGIGGHGTGMADALIYLMRVTAVKSIGELRRESPRIVSYLRQRVGSSRVLVSSEFAYFGDHAVRLPADFARQLIRRQGCKKVAGAAVNRLTLYLRTRGLFPGIHGVPNNRRPTSPRRCGCQRAPATAQRKRYAD